jgi:hypothetical protein
VTLRRWTVLVIVGYLVLATGAVITTVRLNNQADNLKVLGHRLTVAVGVNCEVSYLPDSMEDDALRRASVRPIPDDPLDAVHTPVCKRIVTRLIENR